MGTISINNGPKHNRKTKMHIWASSGNHVAQFLVQELKCTKPIIKRDKVFFLNNISQALLKRLIIRGIQDPTQLINLVQPDAYWVGF